MRLHKISILSFSFCLLCFCSACSKINPPQVSEPTSNPPNGNTKTANLTSIYSTKNGGELTIDRAEDDEMGICHFEDGSHCKEWAYYQELFSGPAFFLEDVSGGDAYGEAWTVVKDDKTYHRVFARNMLELEDDYFYEGWLVNKTNGSFFSTGKMVYNEKYENWLIEYQIDGDKSSYTQVVITLEPDDEDPAPAKHIIQN